VPAAAGYVGVENQLYRVEIHNGNAGDSKPTFKWSRDNGSVEIGIATIATVGTKTVDNVKVTVASFGRDDRSSLNVGDWVEVIDDTTAPDQPPTPLLQVHAIDRAGRSVTLTGTLTTDMDLHPYLRRWDQPDDNPGGPGGLPLVESDAGDSGEIWLNLEDGVQIRFHPCGAEYRPGDYWLIPARTANGGLIWPGGDDPTPLAPHGPTRYLVPLALVETDVAKDMRTLFTHLAWPEPASQAPPAGEGK
jgi:hypothetical protein